MKKLLHAMRKTVTLAVMVLLLTVTQTQAQLVVSAPPAGPNYTALVQSFFVGQGVTVSNVSYTGGAQAIGSFSNTGTNLGLAGGIILTTGNRNLAIGPNNQAGAGSNLNRPGLPELDAQAGAATFDGAVLQFDFVAQSTSVSFQYIWASEEYPEYVNAGYNDAFSFFISGPGFGGPTNIALVPSTTIPITIDNVNSGSYSQYYVNNAGGQFIQYDGFTTTMTANATVQPCQTYTLRICIADAGDHIYDSAVFLGQNSLSSTTVSVAAGSGYNGSSNGAYEGCLPGYVNFSIPAALTTDYTFNYTIGGTAQNGIDYQNIGTSVTIPAGQTSAQVVINAINDNATEAQETVLITVNNACSVSTTTVYINDVVPLTVNAGADQLQCGPPTAATLTATASGGLTPYTYSWSNGVSNVGNTASISNTPAGTTTYTVTATGACPGQTATDQVVVTVNPIPTSIFTLSSATVCNGQPMAATYSGNANSGATYNWSVNNGASITGSGQSVGITYPGPGTYTVSLSVAEGGCTSTTTTTVNFTVYPQPNSLFSAPTTLCTSANGSFNFTGTTIPGATYTWNFNGGTVVSGSGSGPYSINWATAGTKTVTLTVAANGCTSTTTASVNVIQTPASTFTATSPVCTGQNSTVTYTGTVIPGATYTWGFNGGTVASGSGAGPYQINWTTAGTKNITLTVTSNGCTSTTTTVPVVVNSIPTAAFTSSANPVCNGQPLTVSATPVTGATYAWSVNNGATITGSGVGPVTVNYPGVGTYNVSLAVTANGCTSSTTTTAITVNPQPTAIFTASTPLCTGVNGTITYNGTPIPGATYTWNFNGGTVASGSGMGPYQVNWANAGTKTVTLTVAAAGCTATSSQTVVVNQMPTSGFSVSAAQFCAGANGTVTYTGTILPGATYTWNFAGGTIVSGSGVGPYQIAWSTAGSKTITLSVSSNGCTSTVSSQTITIYQVPTSTFTASAATVCAGQPLTATYSGNASTAATYTWSANNSATITGSGQGPVSLNYPSAGAYNITLTVAENGCSSGTTTVPVTVNPQPTAAFTATSPLCTGNNGTVNYTGIQIPGATYTWNFAGGTVVSGSGAGPYTVNWATAGTKNITLTVAAAGCTASSNVNVVVNQMPSSSFSVSNTQFCAGGNATVSYNAVPVTGAVYTWNFNGGTVVSGSGLGPYTVNWSTAGVKTITLSVTANGCTSTITSIPVTIYQVPTSSFTVSSASVCDGTPVNITYSGNASPNATYTWTSSNNGSIGTNPLRLVYPAPGTYNIGLTVSENGCLSTATTIPVTVKPMPTSNFSISASQFCAGANGTITYNGTQITGAVYTWNFNGGTVVSGSGAGPYTINWTTAGTKTITLSVTANGCTSTLSSQTITIYQVPTATFTTSATSVCDGSPINITYGGNASPNATYNWVVNNGGSIGTNPLRLVYPAPGSYNIGLTVSENGCSSTTNTIPVTVHPIPVSTFSVNNSQFCAGANATVTYNGTPINGANYAWNFNGGTVVSGSNLGPYQITWNNPGVKTITLTVSANGCTSSVTSVPVTIYQIPTSTFTLSSNSICDGQAINITYNGNASPNATYTWAVNNGGSISSNPSFQLVYPAVGSYNIGLTVAENGCSSTTTTLPVTVKPQPVATFTAPTPICTGQPEIITYTGTQITGASYSWGFNGAVVASGTNAGPYNVSWLTPGTKNVTLTVNAAGCNASSNSAVVVNQMPTSSFTVSNTQFCAGGNATITFNGVQVQGATYTWNFSGGNIVSGSGMGPYTINWNSAGTKQITLTVSANGCTSSVTTIPVTIYQVPTASFATSAPSICNGQPLNITYNGNASPNANYTWTVNNGGSVASNPLQLVYPGAGNYNITLNVSENGCSSSANTVPVTVYTVPTANFTVQGPICEGASVNVLYTGNASLTNAQFTWGWDGGTASNTINQNYAVQYASAGNYDLTLHVEENGCSSIDITQPLLVNAIPTSTFIATSPVCISDNSVVTYTGSAPQNATYAWDFDNGTVASGQNQGPYNINWNIPGTKSLKLIVTHNGCASPQTIVPVIVNDRPTAAFTIADTSICMGQPVTITYNGTGSPNAIYNWTASGGATVSQISGNNYQMGYPGAGNYTVTLSVTENGCASANPVTATVSVYDMPTSAFVSSGSPMCDGTPLTVDYTGNASPNASYVWNISGGAVIGNINPSGVYPITYPGPGVYNISLTVSENGCTSTQSSTVVTIYQTPTSAFITSASPVCDGKPVDFYYNGNASPNATYNWVASNGASIIANGIDTFSLDYPGAGTYIVKLTITEDGCSSAMSSDTVIVFDVPVSAFAAVQNPVCDGQPVILNYNGPQIPGAVYTWTTPDSVYIEESGLTSYEVFYPGAGTYNVGLKVTANGCPSDTTSVPIVVNSNPTAPFIASNEVCLGANNNIIYTGPQDPNYTYNWNFNGGSVVSGNNQGPYQVNWQTEGTKTVTLIVTNGNGCSSDTTSFPVIVHPIPSASFTATGPLCTDNNGAVYYTGAPMQNATYTWNFDGANVVSGIFNGPYSLNWSTPGTKLVTLQVTANGCSSPVVQQSVVVNPTPTASFVALDSTVCEGSPITLVYNGNASPSANYNWFTTGGATITGTGNGPFTVNYPAPGTYFITLTVDENGCTSPISATLPVTIMPNPNAYFTVPVGECFGNNSYNFLAQGQFTWQADIVWNFGPNANVQTSNIINPSNISFNSTGEQTVSLSVTDNGCTSNFSNMVQVYPDPVIDFSADELRGCTPLEVQFTDNSGYADLATYLWNFGDGNTSSLQNPIHIYTDPGTYSVSLQITFSSACGGSITQNALITVYPQPVAGFSVTPEQTDMFDPFVTVVNEGSGATVCYYTMGDGDTLMNTLGGTHEYSNAGVYTITQYVSNSYGCRDTSVRVVRIDGQFTIYIPNAFSPNNDGINDSFGAKGMSVNNFTLYIFDRWGELIFTGHGIDDYWDGSDPSGKRSQLDVYVYKVVYDEPGGEQKQVVGTVALID